MDGVANLVDKSLIVPEGSEAIGRWRLLETTRAYAIEKLYESGEAGHAARRHAEFYRKQFAEFASEGRLQAHIEDLRIYRSEIDNLRAALNWAFSSMGDATLGVELAAAAALMHPPVASHNPAAEPPAVRENVSATPDERRPHAKPLSIAQLPPEVPSCTALGGNML